MHPDKQHIVYPVGSTLVVENIQTKRQQFLTGHTNNIACLTVSPSGRFLASGQTTHMGFKVSVPVH